jgi:hypothetical protein
VDNLSFDFQVVVRNIYHPKRTGQPGLLGSQQGHTVEEFEEALAAVRKKREEEATQIQK